MRWHTAKPFASWWLLIAMTLLCGGLRSTTSVGQEHELSPQWQDRILDLEREVLYLRSRQATQDSPDTVAATVPSSSFDAEQSFDIDPHRTSMVQSTSDPESEFPTIKVGGFFQADAIWIDQSQNNITTVGDAQDGADFRRARLSASGKVWSNVAYMMEFDFAFPGRPSFMDVYMDVDGANLGTIRFGQWRMPFGMDNLTSVRELTFLERALPFAFSPFRQIGIGIQSIRDDELGTLSYAAFRYPTDTFGGNIGDNGGLGLATRWTALPFYLAEENQFLHVGLNYSFLDPASNQVRYRNTPELFVSETGGAELVPAGVPTNLPVFVDTGAIATTNVNLFGGELAAASGPFHVQSEVTYVVLNQLGGSTETLSGAYAQAAYTLTGESRTYNPKSAAIGRIKPWCNFGPEGIGAWEIAARWSYLDLNSGNIAGGRLQDLTGGLNWYLNPRAKFQFNYIHANLTNRTFGESHANFFALRAQLDY